ncbi:XVIPCD domain-containing protein [Xanthomonas fragariae]
MPGGSPNLTGSYDKATGVVTIPAASFQPGGSAASGDLKAVVGLQCMSVDFAHKTWQDPVGQTHTVDQDMVTNLQATLNGSPVLAAQIKDAVTQGYVQHFSLLGNSMAAGATYDGSTVQQDGTPKGINLPPLGLQSKTAANPQGRYDAQDMTFVLGHEIQHGFNDAAKDRATQAFMQSIGVQARVQGPVHDYTDELRAYIQAGREDEAKAEIAGWNALLSREHQSNPSTTLVDMGKIQNSRIYDFITPNTPSSPSSPLPGLTFNQDASLPQTPANIAAMGQHYFDRPSALHAQPNQRPVHLGEHKPNPTADYANFYGTWALEQIVAAEDQATVRYQGAKPQIAINMAALGLKEDLIEMEGLDLGANKAPRPYLDTSQTPAALGHFHHTQDGSRGHDHQYVPVAPAFPPPASHSVSPLPEQAVLRHQDPLVERFYAALQAGDDQGARAASMAYATPERWQQTLAVAEERVLAKHQQLPGRDNPLFDQALAQLERLGPQAGGYLDRVQMEQVAGAVAYQASLNQLPRIDALTPSQDGRVLLATATNPHMPSLIDRAVIDTAQATAQPLEQSLQQLTAETQRQQDQALFQTQQQLQPQQQGFSL